MRFRAVLPFLLLAAAAIAQTTAQPPEAVLIAPPKYPPLARLAQIQGSVVVQVKVDSSGNVEDVHVVSGHPMLLATVTEAVRKWQFACRADSCLRDFQIEFNFVIAGEQQDDPAQITTLELPKRVTLTVHRAVVYSDGATIRP